MEDDLQALQGIHLSPVLESRLELLAQTAEALGLDEPSIIGPRDLRRNRATALAKLEAELALLRKWTVSLSGVTSPGLETASVETVNGTTETAESLERRRQVIIRKAKEYQAQIIQLNSTNPSSFSMNVSISDLTRLQEQNKEREKEIRLKRKKVEAFRGLPADQQPANSSTYLEQQRQAHQAPPETWYQRSGRRRRRVQVLIYGTDASHVSSTAINIRCFNATLDVYAASEDDVTQRLKGSHKESRRGKKSGAIILCVALNRNAQYLPSAGVGPYQCTDEEQLVFGLNMNL
ncbi:hypothetical protein GG344DRAFT_83442 [Lentinula edodes]|nr:hypothetical protein GG344DRAFT_83442 [Lentinula edodes]